MKESDATINRLKDDEGFGAIAYPCSAGKWTFGFGSTRTIDGRDVVKGLTITEKDAEILLRRDVAQFAKQVSRLVTVPLTQNQFDALVSFAYNLGGGALEKSTLLKKLNAGDYNSAAKEFLKWNKARDAQTGKMRVAQGLTNRRKREMDLFLSRWEIADNGAMSQSQIYIPSPNNTPLRNRDLPIPTAYQEHGVDSVEVDSNTGKIAAVTTTGVAGAGGIATVIADPQIITSGLSFLQAVDWRVAILVVVLIAGVALWIRWRR